VPVPQWQRSVRDLWPKQTASGATKGGKMGEKRTALSELWT